MKTTKIIYYVTTGLLSLFMAFSAFTYLTNTEVKQGFEHLGFPDYFRIELAIAKALSAIALWIPVRLIKEVAYIGLSISFISAFIAHINVGDPIPTVLMPMVVWVILIVSYVMHQKLNQHFELAD